MDNFQKSILSDTARWQKIIGIIMAVSTAFMVLGGIFLLCVGNRFGDESNAFLSQYLGAGMGIVYLLAAAMYFCFTRFLLRSAKFLKAYVASDDEADLTEGLKNNKYYFKFSGILALVSIGIILLVMIVAVIVGLTAA